MANLVTPMPMIRARFFDDNGRPLSGGKIYTYEPNSTTLKTTYKDLAATTPNTNPILLDVAGEADIYFDGQYRVIVESWRGEQLYDVDNIGALAQIKASFVVDASGKTQQQINDSIANRTKTVVSALEFGIVPNSLEDQTAKMDEFLNYLRSNNVAGTIPAGKILVSCNKQKTFGVIGEADYEVVNYALDISGIDLQGFKKGYRNAQGTIIECISQNGVALMQAQQNASNITHYISGFQVKNSLNVMRLTYCVNSVIQDIGFDTTNVDGIILGESTFDSGALLNTFKNINGSCAGRGLDLRGKNWNNANIFENCYIMSKLPSRIKVDSGYGAIANMFIGGEFASPSDGSHGIELNNTAGTTFLNTYFEAHGHAATLTSAKSTSFLNCTYGTTRNNKTTPGYNGFIHHITGVSSVKIDGGSVFINDVTLQSGLRMVTSETKASLTLSLEDNLYVNKGSVSDWQIIDVDTFTNIGRFSGNLVLPVPIVFSGAGASLDGLASTSSATISVAGRNVTFSLNLDFAAGTVKNAGVYYITLPRKSAVGSRSVGMTSFNVGAARQLGDCFVALSLTTMTIRRQRFTSTYNDTTKTVATTQSLDPISNTVISDMTTGDSIACTLNYVI